MKSVRLGITALLLVAGTALAQDYDALIQQSLKQRNAGNFAAAEQTLRQAYAIPPDKSEVSYLLGMVMAFQQRFDEAMDMIDSGLAQHPDSVDLQLARARVLSFQGVYQEANTLIDQVLMWNPNNIEALNLSGRIALYQQRPAVARERFNAVLALAANDLEALIGLYDSHANTGEREEAAPFLGRAAQVAPDHIDVLSRQNPEQYNAQPRNQITTGIGRSTIDLVGFADWTDRFFEYRRLGADGNQHYIRVEHDHRFGTHDTLYEAGTTFQQKSRLPLEVAVGFSPDDEFLPGYYGRLQASTPLTDGSGDYGTVILNAGYQYSSYANGKTHRLQLGLDYYLPGIDAWLSPKAGMVRDQNGDDTFAWSIGANWQVRGPTRIGASYSDAPETENLLTIDTTAVNYYLRQDLGSRWVLFLNYTKLDRELSYIRSLYDLTLQHRY